MAPPQGEVFTVHTERCLYIGGSWVQYCSTVVLLSSINIQGFVRFESFWLSIAVLLITYLVIFFYSHHLMIINLSHSWMKKEMCKKNSVVVRNRSINTMIFVGTIVTSCQVLLSYFMAGWASAWVGIAWGPTKNELYLNKSYSIVLPFTYASCPR